MNSKRGQEFLSTLADVVMILPFAPDLLRELFELTSEESMGSLQDVARAVDKDPGLTVQVLKTANSAYYGLQAEVSTLDRAVSVLGMKEIRTIVLFVALRSVNQRVDPAFFDLDTFWAHQFCVGHAARAMAVSLEFFDPYVMYTAGLLHDMGKLFTVLMRPEDWTAIYDRARIRNLPLHVAEEEYWGIDHALVGAMALKYWNLPDEITEPISWHHAPDKAPDSVVEPAVLALADTLVLNQQDGGQRPISHLLDSFDSAQGAAAVSAAQLSLEDACADRQHGVVF